MFGNPKSFQIRSSKLPVPRNFMGWMFYGGWILAILGPAAAMFWMGKLLEMGIWLVISVVWFSMDLFFTGRRIRRRAERERLFFVGDDDSHVSTGNFELNLKKPIVDES